MHSFKKWNYKFLESNAVESNDPESSAVRPVVLFLLIVLLYIFYQLAMQPNWMLGGEMWAEMATNYFPNASSPSYLDKLFSTDAGYIPVPQRLLALVGNQINLPAESVPYFYTWSATIATGMMVGVFCLAQFRKVVSSDSLRFLTAVAVLMVSDFETRTFINFTYFSAFFIAIITALAAVDDAENVPWWAWFIPILVVSKPAVLASLPMMILVAMVRKSRFRWVAIVAVALCMGQFFQMYLSATGGMVPFSTNEITTSSKLIASIKYFFGFLGGYVAGRGFYLNKYFLMLAGLLVLCVCGFSIIYGRSRARAVIVVGLSLLLFNVILNSFALSDSWTRDMKMLGGVPIYRHIIVGFFGSVLILSGLFSELAHKINSPARGIVGGNLAALLFLGWFLISGWFSFAGILNKEPKSPTVNNSQWQNMAGAIDSGISPLCVPVDPWWKGTSWMYKRGCDVLVPAPAWEDGSVLVTNPLSFELSLPPALYNKNLIAAAILVKPISAKRSFVDVRMVLKLTDGSVVRYSAGRELELTGGMLFLTGKGSVPIKDISAVAFEFNMPVEIALSASDPSKAPGVAWMGN